MKITFDRPTLASKKIAEKKDFDQLLTKVNAIAKKPFYKSGWFITSFFSLSIILSIVLILKYAPENKKNTQVEPKDNEVETISYKEDSPCVSPPSQNFKIELKRFVVDPNIEQKIILKNAEIEIPKLAFKATNQQTITDSVVLDFRIFNDAVDFIVSGIPMKYDSTGTIYTFESAGMFELRGQTVKQEPILISKPLTITFNTNNVDGYNFYSLDTTTKNWKYISSNTTKTIVIEKAVKTKTVNNKTASNAKKELNIANQEWIRAQRSLDHHKKQKPEPPSEVSDSEKVFVLSIDKYEFPELSFFYKVKFEPLDLKSVANSVYTTNWDSKRIRQHKGGDYQLILQNKQTSKIVNVKPVYDSDNLEKMTNIYLKKLERYEEILSQKQELETKRKLALETKQSEIVTPDEKTSAKKTIKSIGKSIVIGLTAPITFFGTFNFDKVVLPRINKDNATPLNIEKIEQPKFVSLESKDAQFEKIYVIESKRNASFSFDLKKKNYLTYNTDSKISIIGFNENEDLFLVDNKQFKNARDNNKPFEGEYITDVTLSVLKRRVLGI